METKRQSRISKQIQKDTGEIFQREMNHISGGTMITVTRVNVTGDLSIAKIYLSLFPTKDKKALMNTIREHSGEIRFHLGNRLKNQLKKIPELQFYLDDSLDYIENIDNLLGE